jgi:uncharacterized phage infection (PIP) family protein YhgE
VNTLKKVLAVLVIIICMVGEAACAGGILFSWSINTPITTAISDALTGLESFLQAADTGLERVATRLTEAQTAADTITETAQTAGETLSETSVVYELLARTVGDELFPKITAARDTVTAVSQTVTAFNDTLEAANKLPFVELPTLTDELETVANRLEEVHTNVQETRAEIQSVKDEAISKPVTAVTDRTERVSDRLGEVLTAVDNSQQRIATSLNRIGAIKAGIPRLIDLLSLASTIVLLWIMLAQGSLLSHAWGYFKGAGSEKLAATSEQSTVSSE